MADTLRGENGLMVSALGSSWRNYAASKIDIV